MAEEQRCVPKTSTIAMAGVRAALDMILHKALIATKEPTYDRAVKPKGDPHRISHRSPPTKAAINRDILLRLSSIKDIPNIKI